MYKCSESAVLAVSSIRLLCWSSAGYSYYVLQYGPAAAVVSSSALSELTKQLTEIERDTKKYKQEKGTKTKLIETNN